MIKGTTENGFEFEIEDKATDDWRIIKAIRECSNDTSYIVDVGERLLGKSQLERLENHVAEKTGYLSASAMTNTIVEILTVAGELKNSEPSQVD